MYTNMNACDYSAKLELDQSTLYSVITLFFNSKYAVCE